MVEEEFPGEEVTPDLPEGSFKLVNRAPSFREMLEQGIGGQIKEVEELITECNKQLKFLKKSKRELRGKTDEALFKMLGDDHAAVSEYKEMVKELNAYIEAVNAVQQE